MSLYADYGLLVFNLLDMGCKKDVFGEDISSTDILDVVTDIVLLLLDAISVKSTGVKCKHVGSIVTFVSLVTELLNVILYGVLGAEEDAFEEAEGRISMSRRILQFLVDVAVSTVNTDRTLDGVDTAAVICAADLAVMGFSLAEAGCA